MLLKMTNEKLYIEILHIGMGCEGWIPTYDNLRSVFERNNGTLPKRSNEMTKGELEGQIKGISVSVEFKLLSEGDSVPEKYRGSPTILYKIGETGNWIDLIEEGGLPMSTPISCRPYHHPNYNQGKGITFVPIELVEEGILKVLEKYEG